MDQKQKTKMLEETGTTLYGDRWQTDLARDIGFSDGRRIRQWMSGERPIPHGFWDTARFLLNQRKNNAQECVNKITNMVKEYDL